MVYGIAIVAMLMPITFGAYLLFTPMKKLVEGVAWMRLSMPEEGSTAYRALFFFWRGVGLCAWLSAAAMAYLFFLRRM